MAKINNYKHGCKRQRGAAWQGKNRQAERWQRREMEREKRRERRSRI